MKSFEWITATSVADAVAALKSAPAGANPDDEARPLAGGQDLLTTMKEYIQRPTRIVNIKGIRGLDQITADRDGGLRIGALATLSQMEEHPVIRKAFPGLAEAAHSVGTPQIRN